MKYEKERKSNKVEIFYNTKIKMVGIKLLRVARKG